MGRYDTESWNAIRSLCASYGMNEKEVYAKAKELLAIYRRLCWRSTERAGLTREVILYYSMATDLDDALIYLEQFAPDKERQEYEGRVAALFKTRWMVELVEEAVLAVKDFPFE